MEAIHKNKHTLYLARYDSWKVSKAVKMGKKFNILIVHNYYRLPGGEDIVVMNEKKLLEEYGHKVILYTRSNTELESYNLISKIALPFSAIFNWRTFIEVQRIIQKENIDIVHVHNTLSLISPSVFYAALIKRTAMVQTLHNFRMICPNALLYRDGNICEECIYRGLKQAVKHNCYRKNKLQTLLCVCILKIHSTLRIYKKINYICLTDFNKNKLLEGTGKKLFNEKHLYVKPNFTQPTTDFIPFLNRKKQFVYVGRPEKEKGIYFLLEAWKQIVEYQLIICGTSDEMSKIQNYITANNMKNISLLGKLSNIQVKEILAESLAMILPTQLYEGFPVTIAESYSCGTPVFGSNIGNTSNLIRDGITGYRFIYNSSQDIVQKVYAIKDMTKECRQYYDENFCPEVNYKKLLQIYNKIVIQEMPN